jgi:hypothetical protein
MARTLRSRVTTAADVKADPTTKEDSYLAKVVRYIPGEIVAAYLAAYNALKAAEGGIPFGTVLWIVAIALGVVTPFWTLYAANDPGKPRPYFQAGAATVGFAVWVFAIPQGPFSSIGWYNPVYGFLVLIFSTLVIPIVEKVVVRA